jgi:hypothetical protein
MQVIFDLPDEVITQLQPFEDKLPQILELGLRELNAISAEGFLGIPESPQIFGKPSHQRSYHCPPSLRILTNSN